MISTTSSDNKQLFQAIFQRDTAFSADAKMSKVYPLLAALGILMSVGGVFTLLAAYQILPAGVNLVSGLGTKGLVFGYVATSAGPIFLVINLLKGRSVQKKYRQVRLGLSRQILDKLNQGEYFELNDKEINVNFGNQGDSNQPCNTQVSVQDLVARFTLQPALD